VFCGEFPEIEGWGVFAYYKRVGEGLDRRGLVCANVLKQTWGGYGTGGGLRCRGGGGRSCIYLTTWRGISYSPNGF